MKGLTFVTLFGMLLVAGAAWGQVEVEWERTYHSGTCFELVGAPDGGCFMVGESHADSSAIVRVDSDGDHLWTREVGTREQIRYHTIIKLAEGGYALGGYNAARFWLYLIDDNGDSVLTQSYNVSGTCNSILQTTDGGFLLVGASQAPDHRTSMFILRLDANGDSLWCNYLRPPGSDGILLCTEARCNSAIQLPGGGFALAGSSSWLAEPGFMWQDPCFIRTNDRGEAIAISGLAEGYGSCQSAIETSNGRIALAGSVWFNDPSDDPTGFFIHLLGSDFRSRWSRVYDIDYSMEYSVEFEDLLQTQDGGFLLAGTKWRWDGSSSEFVLVRTSADGDSLWSAMLVEGANKACHSIIQADDDGFFLAGTLFDDNGAPSFYLVKTTPDPLFVTKQISQLTSFSLSPAYPNPFNSATRIEFGLRRVGAARLEVFDPLGRKVKDLLPGQMLSAGSHAVSWDAEGLPSGRYLIRLKTAEGQQTARSAVLIK